MLPAEVDKPQTKRRNVGETIMVPLYDPPESTLSVVVDEQY